MNLIIVPASACSSPFGWWVFPWSAMPLARLLYQLHCSILHLYSLIESYKNYKYWEISVTFITKYQSYTSPAVIYLRRIYVVPYTAVHLYSKMNDLWTQLSIIDVKIWCHFFPLDQWQLTFHTSVSSANSFSYARSYSL